MRQFIPCLLTALSYLTAGACSEPAAPPNEGSRVRIVETYGADAKRSVTLTAMLSSDVEGATEISGVEIEVSPAGTLLVQKLEMLLEDAGFRWRPGQDAWPTLLRAVPPEAIPMIRRLQLALLLLDGAPAIEVDCSSTDLLSAAPSMGLTRVVRQGEAVTVASLALAMTPTGSQLAWGHATGELSDSGVELVGLRRVGPEGPETVTTVVSRVASAAPAPPAGR